MGIIRKTMSVGTGGIVDFRSDKERTASYTKKGAKEATRARKIAEAQAKLAQARGNRDALREHREPTNVNPSPAAPPASWLIDPEDPNLLRWWDGTRMTEHTQPR